MYEWPGELTSNQQEMLKQFRENVKDILQPKHDDIFLIRWLIARDYDLKKSEAMIRKSFTWRKEVGADTILEDWQPPEVVKKYYSGGLCGYDKDGCPLWIDPFGLIDLKGIVHSAKKQDIVKSKVYVCEQIHKEFERRTKELGRRIDQLSLIFDLDQVHLGHLYKPGMDVFCEILAMFEDHYPETLKANYVINAPRFFPVAFKIIRPFLSERTVGKVKVYGRDHKEQILKYIDSDQLPEFMGGTLVDSNNDPKCQEWICMGGEVPKSYYMMSDMTKVAGMTSATVQRGSTLHVDIDVERAGSVVRWQFFTEENDVSFGIFHKSLGASKMKANNMDEVLKNTRVNSHLVPEDGFITCGHPGTYVLRFDNTYSWIKAKKVHYIVDVVPPETLPHTQSQASFSSVPEEDMVYSSHDAPKNEGNETEEN